MANLQQVGIQQLEKLKAIYSLDQPKYCKEFLCLENYLELNQRNPHLRNVKVFCLPNLQHGLFVILDRYYVFLGCKESVNCDEILRKCLHQLNWFGGQQFASMPLRYLAVVIEVLEAKQMRIEHNHKTGLLFLSKESALQFRVELPPGFVLKPLTFKDAKTVNEHWKYKDSGSLFFIQRQILFNTSVGLYEEATNELVAWCLREPGGLLAALQVKDSHQRRGFGALIVREFSRRVALQGHDTFAEVDSDNIASASLFDKLGFEVIDQCNWLVTETPNGDFQWPVAE